MERVVVVALASIFLVGPTVFAGVPLISADSFVRLAVDSRQLSLPDVPCFGSYRGAVSFKAFVVAKCRYSVVVSFAGFENENGVRIQSGDTTVYVEGVSVPVGGGGVAVHSGPRTWGSGVEVPIELSFVVENLTQYPAGSYAGAIDVTVLACKLR